MTGTPLHGMTVLLLLVGCATSNERNTAFNDWMVSAEIACNRRYGSIPTWMPEERQWFRKTAYQAYSGDLSREAFADRLRARYPDFAATAECLAGAVPATR